MEQGFLTKSIQRKSGILMVEFHKDANAT